jgi:dephospho-CoA kinase
MKKKTLIGLTGPIASGKNLAARIFGRHGAYVIDADVIGHQILQPQSKVWHMIVKTFGSKVLSRGGRVNRKKLGRLVFSDPKALKKLNAISHPAIKRRIVELINASKKKMIVVNAAILFEMKISNMMDKIVLVTAKKSVRLKRLLKKGKKKEDALARINSQRNDAEYRKIADIAVSNNSTKTALCVKIINLLKSEISIQN